MVSAAAWTITSSYACSFILLSVHCTSGITSLPVLIIEGFYPSSAHSSHQSPWHQPYTVFHCILPFLLTGLGQYFQCITPPHATSSNCFSQCSFFYDWNPYLVFPEMHLCYFSSDAICDNEFRFETILQIKLFLMDSLLICQYLTNQSIIYRSTSDFLVPLLSVPCWIMCFARPIEVKALGWGSEIPRFPQILHRKLATGMDLPAPAELGFQNPGH